MADLSQAHDRLLQDHTIQFRFPDPLALEPPPPPSTWSLHGWGPSLFWIIVAAACLVLLAVAIQTVRGGFGPRRARPGADSAVTGEAALPADTAPILAVLADADALAGSGEYAAAVHALLLRGVGAIQGRFPRALRPAHTSRDIAALGDLPPTLRATFSGIAAYAERAVFAQAPLGREEWEACRALYAGLVAPA